MNLSPTLEYRWLFVVMLSLALLPATASFAQEAATDATPETAEAGTAATDADPAPEVTLDSLNTLLGEKSVALDTVWVMVTAFLVMWMQAGFALVEAGLTRAKNAVNICMKNLLDFCFGSLAFWAVGFALMFGTGTPYFGQTGWFLDPEADFSAIAWTAVPLEAKFFFQLVFAATTATIVSGAMAERTKFTSYMIYSFFVSLLIYPISGHWIWGGGWLQSNGFWDFAGSTVVHSCGGWLALVGSCVLGPRLGKYRRDGKANAIPGHNLVLVTLGVFILWLGWFGFNPGSTMAAAANDIAHITCTTNSAAAAGAICALTTARIMFKKWEATMALNGALAGLVAITAPCPWVSIGSAIIIGAIGGVLVVLSVVTFDQVFKIDDPVGAISVHGVCGAWGTLAIGLFSTGAGASDGTTPLAGLFYGGGVEQLMKQAMGVGAMFLWATVTGSILFLAIKSTVGLRVSEAEEREGLDFGEHGNEAYHGFQFIEGV